MTVYWRNLLLALLAWHCGDTAVDYIPRSSELHLDRISHFFTLLMFKPAVFLFPMFLVSLASVLLYYLLKAHGRQLFCRHFLTKGERLIHAVIFVLSLFVAYLQLVKMPLFTALFLVSLLCFHLYGYLRSRMLHEEVSRLIRKN
jgi:hypothetical protein